MKNILGIIKIKKQAATTFRIVSVGKWFPMRATMTPTVIFGMTKERYKRL